MPPSASRRPLAVILMKTALKLILISISGLLISCNLPKNECENIEEWKVENYTLIKKECPDLVARNFYRIDVYENQKVVGASATKIDSCNFTWQKNNETFLEINVCTKKIKTSKPNKINLNMSEIDSISIFSNENQTKKRFNKKQTEKFVKDWNNSSVRGFSKEDFDSAFKQFPAYQYKITVYSKNRIIPFYGYNYLILDNSNWKYEMDKKGKLNYFHNYWK